MCISSGNIRHLAVLLFLIATATPTCQAIEYDEVVANDNPIAYWRFDEAGKGDGVVLRSAKRLHHARDESGEVAGIYHGRVSTADGVPGIGGKALRLDGAASHAEIAAHPLLKTDAFTVEFWFRSTQRFDQPSAVTFISKAGNTEDGSSEDGHGYWSIGGTSQVPGTDQGRLAAVTGPKDGSDHVALSLEAVRLNDGQWHHVVVSRSQDGEKRLYLDGDLSSAANDGTPTVTNDGPVRIGAPFGKQGRFLAGDLDELAVYGNALSPEQIAVHYATAFYGSRLPAATPRRVDFIQDVQPIFRNHCVACHGDELEEGGLNLSVRARAFEGGDSVIPIVPGSSAASPLIQFVARLVEDRAMPPADEQLSEEQIGILRAWIDQGAMWPDEASGIDQRTVLARQHWALQPIKRPPPPDMSDNPWVRNDIDAFVVARLTAKGLRPAKPADGLTLLRRAHIDLTGLPPSAETVLDYAERHQEDFDPYEDLLTELLQSQHYGERYGRHWLDVVRYSDSAGYELDTYYEHAWKYRDYVIESFNRDKPFDRFIQEQLAADELWPSDESLRHATGLLTVGPYHFESGIFRPEIQEYKWLTDVTDTVGSTFLGLTVGCARCHSHKFDPISQKDYFGLQAIFAGSTLWDERTERPPDNSAERRKPQNWIIVNRDIPATVRVLYRGDLKSPGVTAAPAIFRSIDGGGTLDEAAPGASKQRRAKLARWLTDSNNPLTARVLANRVWQWHFGEGLVRTPNDFGTQGDPPTHPRLLDYLADELRSHGWSLKYLHRLIMQSNTYRMASDGADAAAMSIDPRHELLWRYPRRRLEAELIWDNLHATAGTLNRQQFGPPVVPPVDEVILATKVGSKWNVTDDPAERSRRGLYVIVRRSLKFPFFETFNLNEPSASCGRRDTTVVSPQALTLLNGKLISAQSRAFAGRLVREFGEAPADWVRGAWLLAFSRPCSSKEVEQSLAFLEESEQRFANSAVLELIGPTGLDHTRQISTARGAALVEFCRALFNANEFIYID